MQRSFVLQHLLVFCRKIPYNTKRVMDKFLENYRKTNERQENKDIVYLTRRWG